MKSVALTLALLLFTSLAHAQTSATNPPVDTQDVFADLKQTDKSVGYSGNAAQEKAQSDMAKFCNSNGPTYSAARCTAAMQSYRNVKPQGK